MMSNGCPGVAKSLSLGRPRSTWTFEEWAESQSSTAEALGGAEASV